MHDLDTDVLIIGAGPAGATAALNLALYRSVIMVDRFLTPVPRIGESLPPSARPLLEDMDLFEDFCAQNHSICYGNRTVWETIHFIETDFLRDPRGHGWHLDRVKFEELLRRTAIKKGAHLLVPSKLTYLERVEKGWIGTILRKEKTSRIRARAIIDASGRSSFVSKKLGALKKATDRLVCGWFIANDAGEMAGLSYIEATSAGWWYTAPIPDKKRIVSFYTDSDLKEAVLAREPRWLLSEILKSPGLSKAVGQYNVEKIYSSGFTAANSAYLIPCAGPDWIAVGDAALSFDPISSQGLFNALYTGLFASKAIYLLLEREGDQKPIKDYQAVLSEVWDVYQKNLSLCYQSQPRWPDSPFWGGPKGRAKDGKMRGEKLLQM